MPAYPEILSYGMGVESTAIILRWLTEPASRDFDLADLVVLTAMTGDEFAETGSLVETHILPRLAAAGVRYVQLARSGHLEGDGYEVLSDTAGGARVHLEGRWKLSDEMRTGGTVPQQGGARKCSMHFKGFVLDRWVDDNIVGPFRHSIGFAVGEERRVAKDRYYGDSGRRLPAYPLMEWGWDRAKCVEFIASVTGVEAWPKSCCVYCPFAKDHHLERYRAHPESAVEAMVMEHRSVALNPRQLLFNKRSVVRLITESGNSAAVAAFDHWAASTDYSLYEVQRAIEASKADPTKKGNAVRSVKVHATGTFPAMHRLIRDEAERRGMTTTLDEWGLVRLVIYDFQEALPIVTHHFVVAPAGAVSKQRASFATVYNRALARVASRVADDVLARA